MLGDLGDRSADAVEALADDVAGVVVGVFGVGILAQVHVRLVAVREEGLEDQVAVVGLPDDADAVGRRLKPGEPVQQGAVVGEVEVLKGGHAGVILSLQSDPFLLGPLRGGDAFGRPFVLLGGESRLLVVVFDDAVDGRRLVGREFDAVEGGGRTFITNAGIDQLLGGRAEVSAGEDLYRFQRNSPFLVLKGSIYILHHTDTIVNRRIARTFSRHKFLETQNDIVLV